MKKNAKIELTPTWWNTNKPATWNDTKLGAALSGYAETRTKLEREKTEDLFDLACKLLDAVGKQAEASLKLAKKTPDDKALKKAKVEKKAEEEDYKNTEVVLKKFGSSITLEKKNIEDLVEEEDEAGLLLDENKYKKYLKKTMLRMQSKAYSFALALDKPSQPEGHRFLFHKTKPGKKLGLTIVDEVEGLEKKKLTWGMAGADTEDGKTMVLMLEHKQLPGMEKHTKKFLKKFKPLPFEQIKLVSAETGDVLQDIPDPEDTDGEDESGQGMLDFTERRNALEPRLLKAQKADREKAQKLSAAWNYADEKAQAHNFSSANKALDGLEVAINSILAAPPQSLDVNAEVLPFAKARLNWARARDKMGLELRKLQDAIVNACDGDEQFQSVADKGVDLTPQLAQLDERLEYKLDDIVNSQAGPAREKFKTEARQILDDYREEISKDFYKLVDKQNGFTEVAVTSTAKTALTEISQILS